MANCIFLRACRQTSIHTQMLVARHLPVVVPHVEKSCWFTSRSGDHNTDSAFCLRLCVGPLAPLCQQPFHTSAASCAWESHNKTVYPPQKPGEPRRPAEIFYARKDIKHSQRKMWYIATFIKGMMIDDALTQLDHINKKAAKIAKEVLLEAQEEAMKNHNVEFKSNLHISEALVGKGRYQHAIRYHAKGRASMLDLVYCHLFIKLKEGPPPEKPHFTGYDQAEHYLKSKRSRTITHGL